MNLIILLLLVNPAELEKDVDYLASDDLQGRQYASVGMEKASNYVFRACKKMKIDVQYQTVYDCRNVIAWIEGREPHKIIVVGAHLDHVGVKMGRIFNGADDNASGSAAVLELARRFSKLKKPRYTISFQWYTGEERGFIGSKYYVKHPLFKKIKNHIFMLNLDMVGRADFGADDNFLDKYPFSVDITLRNAGGSDQVSFAPFMQTIFLHTGLHKDYHKPSDDSDKINYEGLNRICDYAFDIVIKIMKVEYRLMNE